MWVFRSLLYVRQGCHWASQTYCRPGPKHLKWSADGPGFDSWSQYKACVFSRTSRPSCESLHSLVCLRSYVNVYTYIARTVYFCPYFARTVSVFRTYYVCPYFALSMSVGISHVLCLSVFRTYCLCLSVFRMYCLSVFRTYCLCLSVFCTYCLLLVKFGAGCRNVTTAEHLWVSFYCGRQWSSRVRASWNGMTLQFQMALVQPACALRSTRFAVAAPARSPSMVTASRHCRAAAAPTRTDARCVGNFQKATVG
jgi:hypothetical protein